MEKGDSDLRSVLQTYKTTMPLYKLMNLWHQMLLCVDYIHSKDVIHSDLKPENFLMVHGRLKLIDFGISSKIAVDATSIIKYSQVGTFNYISPEALMDTSTGNSPFTKRNQPKIKVCSISFRTSGVQSDTKRFFSAAFYEVGCMVAGLHPVFDVIQKNTVCSH